MRGTVVLFNRDLRVHDHPALHHAVASADWVIPLFVLDPQLVGVSPNRTRFLLDCVDDLRTQLRQRGGDLVVAAVIRSSRPSGSPSSTVLGPCSPPPT